MSLDVVQFSCKFSFNFELTNEARAEISSLNLCLARRKKTIVNEATLSVLSVLSV